MIFMMKDYPLGGNPEVGNPESISHQDCPPQLLCFFMNCLCSIWALGECWGLRQCIQSQYFEEQSNLCDLRRHLKTQNREKSNKWWIPEEVIEGPATSIAQQLKALKKTAVAAAFQQKSTTLWHSSVNSLTNHHQLKIDWSSILLWSTGFKNQSKLSNVTGVKKF